MNEMQPSEKQPYETVQSFEFVAGPARIYRSQDGLHEVVIADNQAAEWDRLRHFHEQDKNRLAPDVMPKRGNQNWTDDVFAAIKQLPNPYLVTQVVLQNALPTAQAFATGRVVAPMFKDR